MLDLSWLLPTSGQTAGDAAGCWRLWGCACGVVAVGLWLWGCAYGVVPVGLCLCFALTRRYAGSVYFLLHEHRLSRFMYVAQVTPHPPPTRPLSISTFRHNGRIFLA